MIVGIDPGLTGAIAWLHDDGTLGEFDVEDMPVWDGHVDFESVHAWIEQSQPDLVVIEAVQSRPGQGVQSVATTHRNYGMLLAAVQLARPARIEIVSASKWKRAMGLTADKDRSRRLAAEKWPQQAHLFARKKDDGRAEAALLAEWGRTRL